MKFEYHVNTNPAAMLRAATRSIRSPRFPQAAQMALSG